MSFAFMPLYTGDYLRDTQHLSCSEHGIFLKLLMHCWDQKGPAPLDERKLCGIVNARSSDEVEAMRRVLREFFVAMADGWYNNRMQKEVDRSEAISWKRSEAGKVGAEARAKQLPTNAEQESTSATTPTPTPTPIPSLTPTQKKKPTDEAKASRPANIATFEAYANAYRLRYRADPVRNASVNAQIANFVKRVGAEDAPHVAAWFLSHQASWYVTKGHSVASMLADAEKLRTEWATGNRVTATAARQADRTQTTGDIARKLIQEIEDGTFKLGNPAG